MSAEVWGFVFTFAMDAFVAIVFASLRSAIGVERLSLSLQRNIFLDIEQTPMFFLPGPEMNRQPGEYDRFCFEKGYKIHKYHKVIQSHHCATFHEKQQICPFVSWCETSDVCLKIRKSSVTDFREMVSPPPSSILS